MYLPINTNGYQVFTQSGEAAGWYQLDVPGAVLDVLPGITLPPEATAMAIQAGSDLVFCQSPATAVGGATGMTLAAGQTFWFVGRQSIYNFCADLGASGGSFLIQYYQGSADGGPVIS